MPLNFVRAQGTGRERIAIIGEAGGSHENASGLPFQGPAGWKLNEWLKAAGINRHDCYIDNVFPFQPPQNKIELVPRAELEQWIDQLHRKLAKLADPWLIVPMGNTALRALTGKASITKHRGSIYAYTDRNGRTIKVIPTIHPAAVFRVPSWEGRCRRDWLRIAGDREFRDLRLPEREHFVRPTLRDVADFVADVERLRESPLSLDIETPGGEVACVGFAYGPEFSLTVPTTLAYWRTDADLAEAWRLIRRLCALPNPKVTQNGSFDAYYLADHGVTLTNWEFDCLGMHHALESTEEHSLAFMASVDTRQPYWKESWKDAATDTWKTLASKTTDDALWIYNGIDAAVQRELAETYAKRLAERGLTAFYAAHYRDLYEPLLRMMRRGLRVDDAARAARLVKLMEDLRACQARITAYAGVPLHATQRTKKQRESGKLADLSHKKVAAYLYETLKLPKQVNRATGRVTTTEVTVRRLMLKHGVPARQAGQLTTAPADADVQTMAAIAQLDPQQVRVTLIGTEILNHRRWKKVSEFLDEGRIDVDGRMRCTYKLTTETGRLASAKNPRGTGRNMQNIDREIRDIYVADDGLLLMTIDASQIEDRIVKVLAAALPTTSASRRAELLWRARAMPWENDEHIRAAVVVFAVEATAVSKPQRYVAKRARHAGNYGVGGNTLSDALLNEGFTYSPEECRGFIDAILDKDMPEVREWQADVRRRIVSTRRMTNNWGRELCFAYERLDDGVFRRGYAFEPQSSCADLINQYGLVPAERWLTAERRRSQIVAQTHDSLTIEAHPDEAWEVWTRVRTGLERPRVYRPGFELVVPVTLTIGRNWAGAREFKRPPEREEFEAAVQEVLRA